MEFYQTDDVALELSTIIEELSETNCENVKIPHKGSESPAVYKQIMNTKFPPNSPNFVKPEQNTNNSIDPSIINTVAGLNIYNRQILTMNEVDRITCYYPTLDHLHPPTSDKEKADPSGQETMIDNQNKDNNMDKAIADTPLPIVENSINNHASFTSFENGEPYERNLKKPYSHDLKESADEILIPGLSMEENQEPEEQSNVGKQYFSPCCFGIRSDTKEATDEDTEYEPKKIENDRETDLLSFDDVEYKNVSVDDDEEKLLPSEDTESDMSNMSNDEEKAPLKEDSEYTKLNMDSEMTSDEKSQNSEASVEENEENKIQEPENPEFSYINLEEQREPGFISNSQTTSLDNKDQDKLLSSNDLKKKKKKSILKRLFSRKHN